MHIHLADGILCMYIRVADTFLRKNIRKGLESQFLKLVSNDKK